MDTVRELNDKVMAELMTNEEEMAKLWESNPDVDSQEINNSTFAL